MSKSRGDYVLACDGDEEAAILLYRIAFLSRHSKIVVERVRCFASTREDMMAEASLTKYGYDRGIYALRRMGFIKTLRAAEAGLTKLQNRMTVFMLTDKAMLALIDARDKRYGGRAHFIDVEEFTEAIFGHDDPVAHTGSSPDSTGRHRLKSWGHRLKTGGSSPEMNRNTLYEESTSNSSEAVASQAPRGTPVQQIERAFREAYKKLDPTYYHGPNWAGRGRDAGAAAKLHRLVVEAGVDPDTIVRGVVANWSKFADFVRERSSKRITENPDIFSLFVHARFAIQFMETHKTKTVVQFDHEAIKI